MTPVAWKTISLFSPPKLAAILALALFLSFQPAKGVCEDSKEGAPSTPAPAPDTSSSRLNLKNLIGLAFENNPRLKAAMRKWEASIERYPQVTAYEDPMFQYTRFVKKMEGRETQSFGVMQEVPFPGKLSLKGDIAAKEAKMARIEFEKEIRDVIVELKEAFYEYCYTTRAIEITKKNEDLAGQLAKIGEADYAADGTTLNDVFKAQSQLAQLSYDLVLLAELKEVQAARINAILDRAPESPLADPPLMEYKPFDYSLDRFYELARANRQELAVTEVEIEKAEKELDLAKMGYLPDFKVGFDYMDMKRNGGMGTSSGEGGKDAYTVNLGMTLPIWIGKNSSRVEEARLRKEGAEQKKKSVENETWASVKAAYFKIRNSDRLVRLYKDSLLPQAAQSMETAETWYKDKKGSFSGLLETQSVWLNFNLAQQRALADFYQGMAWMEKLVGVSIGSGAADERR